MKFGLGIVIIALLFLAMPLVQGACPTPSGFDANAIYYQCFTITTANQLPPNAIVPVTLNGLTYNTIVANSIHGSISSVTSANGFKLPSWIEGNTLNPFQSNALFGTGGSANVLIWVNTYNSIANTMSIYVNFGTNTINYLNNNWIGIAPQLFCAGSTCSQTIYGQFDNGNTVFPVYQDFKDASTPSGWTLTGTKIVINNGLSISAGAGQPSAVNTLANYGLNPNAVFDSLIKSSETNANVWVGYVDYNRLNQMAYYMDGIWWYSQSGGSNNHVDTGIANGAWHIQSGYYPNSVTSSWFMDYGVPSAYTTGLPSVGIPLGLSETDAGATGATLLEWIRIRTYADGGVMPSITNDIINIVSTTTTSTSTTTTTSSTTTSSTTTSTTTSSTTTAPLPVLPANSLQEAFLYSFNIPFFGYALLLLAFGISWTFSRNMAIASFFTIIFGWILANPLFPIIDIYTITILTTLAGIIIIPYYIFTHRHR